MFVHSIILEYLAPFQFIVRSHNIDVVSVGATLVSAGAEVVSAGLEVVSAGASVVAACSVVAPVIGLK